jgi:hypothetical protein
VAATRTAHALREAEVDDANRARAETSFTAGFRVLGEQQDVRRLEIAVRDARGVQSFEPERDFIGDERELVVAIETEHFVRTNAGHVLHRVPDGAVRRGAELEDLHDRGVTDARQDFEFAREVRPTVDLIRSEVLERAFRAGREIACEEHLAHAALPERT